VLIYMYSTYRFSNMHGPRQPAWEYYDDYMNWIARTQYVVQSGIPKIDLAFWLKLDQYFSVTDQYEPLDLEQAGEWVCYRALLTGADIWFQASRTSI